MNKYLHVLGFTIGLVAVTAFSAVNGALIAKGNGGESGGKAYALLWLASYLLTAVETGELIVRKEKRKFLFLPLLTMACTTLFFFARYDALNQGLAAAFLGGCVATQGATLATLRKSARVSVAGALIDLIWYCFLMGEAVARAVTH